MGEPESLVHGSLADTEPGDIPLADVHDSLGIVDQVVICLSRMGSKSSCIWRPRLPPQWPGAIVPAV